MTAGTDLLFCEDDIDLASDFPRFLALARRAARVTYLYLHEPGGTRPARARPFHWRCVLTQTEFIQQVRSIAAGVVGVNPEATAAHAALESAFGQSQLTREANNLFGVTKGSWPGPVINLPTREYVDGEWVTVTRAFRRYSTWLESVTDYAGIAARLYPWAVEHRANPLAWLTGLFVLGPYRWATDPNIYPKVVAILDKFDLLDPRPEQHQLGVHEVIVDNAPTLGKAVGQAVAVFAREPAIIRAPHLVTRTRRADGSWKLDIDAA